MRARDEYPGQVRINGHGSLEHGEAFVGPFFFYGINECLQHAAGKGTLHIGLCGGTTPQEAYTFLGEHNITPWEHMHFWQIDERAVPYDHPDNNGSMIINRAKRLMNFYPKHFHRIKTELGAEKAAEDYEAELQSFFPDKKPKLDLLVTAITPDGHVASLFPHSPALDETERCVISTYVEKLEMFRITMTMPLLASAKYTVLLGKGVGRAEMTYLLYSNMLDPKEIPLAGLNLNSLTRWQLTDKAGDEIFRHVEELEERFKQKVLYPDTKADVMDAPIVWNPIKDQPGKDE